MKLNIKSFNSFTKSYELDPRSLALFRYLACLIMFLNLFGRLHQFNIFYAGNSLLNLSLFYQQLSSITFFGYLLDQNILQISLFIICTLSAFFVFFNKSCSIFTILTYTSFVAILNLNPFINYGADTLLAKIFLWGFILRWSHNFQSTNPQVNETNPKLKPTHLAYILQIAIIYIFAGLSKTSYEWTVNHEAVLKILSTARHLNFQDSSILNTIINHELIHKNLTIFIPKIEIALGVLLLLPNKNTNIRTVILILLCIMHAVFSYFLNLDQWNYLPFLALTPLIPSSLWDSFFYKSEKKPIIIKSSYLNLQNITLILIFLIYTYLFFSRPSLIKMNISNAMRAIHLHQRYPMFNNANLKLDGWLAFNATTYNSERINLITNLKYSDDRPKSLNEANGNDRLEHLLSKLIRSHFKEKESISNILAQNYCEINKKKFTKIQIAYFSRESDDINSKYTKKTLKEYSCY